MGIGRLFQHPRTYSVRIPKPPTLLGSHSYLEGFRRIVEGTRNGKIICTCARIQPEPLDPLPIEGGEPDSLSP